MSKNAYGVAIAPLMYVGKCWLLAELKCVNSATW